MKSEFTKIGFQNLVRTDRVVAVVSPDASPIKRLIQEARERGGLIDASCGRKTRSVFILDSDHVVLSAWTIEEVERQWQMEEAEDGAGTQE